MKSKDGSFTAKNPNFWVTCDCCGCESTRVNRVIELISSSEERPVNVIWICRKCAAKIFKFSLAASRTFSRHGSAESVERGAPSGNYRGGIGKIVGSSGSVLDFPKRWLCMGWL